MAVAQYIITARIVYRRFGMVYLTREMALEAIGNHSKAFNGLQWLPKASNRFK